jgi:uncharacterized lipoprotein YajG
VKSKITILGLISILLLVVFASGCTSNEKVLYEYNLSAGESPNYIGVQNVTVPNGTNNIKVEAQNLEILNSSLNTSYVNIYALSTVPVTVTVTGNDTELIKNYNASVLVQKTFDLNNETSKTFTYTFNDSKIKGFLIVNVNAKGLIKIFTS